MYFLPIPCTCSAVTALILGTNSARAEGGSPLTQFVASVLTTAPLSELVSR